MSVNDSTYDFRQGPSMNQSPPVAGSQTPYEIQYLQQQQQQQQQQHNYTNSYSNSTFSIPTQDAHFEDHSAFSPSQQHQQYNEFSNPQAQAHNINTYATTTPQYVVQHTYDPSQQYYHTTTIASSPQYNSQFQSQTPQYQHTYSTDLNYGSYPIHPQQLLPIQQVYAQTQQYPDSQHIQQTPAHQHQHHHHQHQYQQHQQQQQQQQQQYQQQQQQQQHQQQYQQYQQTSENLKQNQSGKCYYDNYTPASGEARRKSLPAGGAPQPPPTPQYPNQQQQHQHQHQHQNQHQQQQFQQIQIQPQHSALQQVQLVPTSAPPVNYYVPTYQSNPNVPITYNYPTAPQTQVVTIPIPVPVPVPVSVPETPARRLSMAEVNSVRRLSLPASSYQPPYPDPNFNSSIPQYVQVPPNYPPHSTYGPVDYPPNPSMYPGPYPYPQQTPIPHEYQNSQFAQHINYPNGYPAGPTAATYSYNNGPNHPQNSPYAPATYSSQYPPTPMPQRRASMDPAPRRRMSSMDGSPGKPSKPTRMNSITRGKPEKF
eukprot:NODE_2053_length_1704_cov_28.877925_g1756_i0.p1 GENE.NODE_2053_length_1704_cov_28.877925_g1756_i0~~NODE_2053_length_1704_cov_28.877925_g1756_i0.p1  ORF type:complete len:537 (-),score=200.44 NODE_2053_length_1704_cov_28.877925_g1756_i0:28-1638(-)